MALLLQLLMHAQASADRVVEDLWLSAVFNKSAEPESHVVSSAHIQLCSSKVVGCIISFLIGH